MLRLMIGCGAVRYRQGRQREAIKWCESTLAEAERVGDTIAMGHACDLLQTACHAARDVRAREYGLRAVELFEKAGAVQFLPGALNNLGNAYYVVGRWDEARSLYERSRDAHLEVGEELHAAVVSNNIADILANQGKAAEAASLYEEALATGVAAQHAFQHFFRSNLARVLARVGSVDVALTLLEEARTGMAALRVPQYVAQIDLRRAEILLQANRIDGAAEALLQADDLADGDIAEHRRGGAGIALSQGRLDDARALALESLAVSRQAQDRYQTALALDCVSAVHRRLGLDDAGIVEERDVIFAQLGVVDPPRLSEQFVLHAASLGVTVRAVDPATVG